MEKHAYQVRVRGASLVIDHLIRKKREKKKNSAPANNLGEGTTIVKITK